MTTATMNWPLMKIEIEGHAGYAAKGSDIVCAGISTLSGALVGALQDAEARGRTNASWEKPAEDRLIITADPNMSSVNEVKAYFRMCVKGLRMLQEQYPNNIKVRELSL